MSCKCTHPESALDSIALGYAVFRCKWGVKRSTERHLSFQLILLAAKIFGAPGFVMRLQNRSSRRPAARGSRSTIFMLSSEIAISELCAAGRRERPF